MINKGFYQIFVIGVFVILANGAFGQAFNPYQHAYQGWNGEKIRKANFIRAFLNKFSVNTTLGYGRTFYSHIVQADVLETPERLVMLGEYTVNGNNVDYTGIVDWLNAPTIVDGNATIGPSTENNILYTDSSQIKYGGS